MIFTYETRCGNMVLSINFNAWKDGEYKNDNLRSVYINVSIHTVRQKKNDIIMITTSMPVVHVSCTIMNPD